LASAFVAFDSAERPRRWLQLFKEQWPPFRDLDVAAESLVHMWSGFDTIPHGLFLMVLSTIGRKRLNGAM
jgi:hypothetical protein